MWNDEERQAVSKGISFSYNLLRHNAKTMKKRPKMVIFGLAEKCSHNLEPSFSAIIQFWIMTNISKEAPRCANSWNLVCFEKVFYTINGFVEVYLLWNFGVTLLRLGKTVSNGRMSNVQQSIIGECLVEEHRFLDGHLADNVFDKYVGNVQSKKLWTMTAIL